MKQPTSITGRIRAALRKNPDLDAHALAKAGGCSVQRAREMRWRIIHPAQARLQAERYNRSLGVRPIEQVRAEQAQRAADLIAAYRRRQRTKEASRDQRTEAVLSLREKGLSFTLCAQQLQMTKGEVAGIVFRAQRTA